MRTLMQAVLRAGAHGTADDTAVEITETPDRLVARTTEERTLHGMDEARTVRVDYVFDKQTAPSGIVAPRAGEAVFTGKYAVHPDNGAYIHVGDSAPRHVWDAVADRGYDISTYLAE